MTKKQILENVITRFPEISTRGASRVAYQENKALFLTRKHAYDVAQTVRGEGRKKDRKYATSKSSFKSGGVPEGKQQLKDWKPFVVAGPMRCLVLSDLHIPYHEKTALMGAIKFGVKEKADTILLNGDVADFFAISRWEKDPRQRNFKLELQTVSECLAFIRGAFPKARIIYKLGNHEERLESYMRVKAPELLGIEALELAQLLHLLEIGIEVVEHKRPIQLGDLSVIHGHEYRFAISNPVNPARGLFLRCKAYAMCGHFHQASYHSEKTVKQNAVAAWSTGCLCDLHPEYLPMNNWCHGFAFVEVDKHGKFNVQNKTVKNGVIY